MMKRVVETEETKSTAFEGVLQETESERGREPLHRDDPGNGVC